MSRRRFRLGDPPPRRLDWKVMPGFSDGEGGVHFDNRGTGIPIRSFGTEAAARAAAEAMVTPDEDRCCFAACRLWHSLVWEPGIVDEYRPTKDDRFTVRRLDLVAQVRAAAAAVGTSHP